ncbi:pantoate--beta-alanine ligase [Chryseolinea sp. T2]|uniref:pantoate--beta-alanine ligase n=1 Tax=Chryseolinea sp. T2 TaxID=3129255 RepID=UPI00307853C6
MKIFNEIGPLRTYLKEITTNGRTVGLVPTMGALHEGHISLVEASKKANDITISTIYVNPTQFNNPSDLQKYPRTLEQDAALLEKVSCDVLFCPTDAEMYPDKTLIKFDFGHLDKVMEGEFRPGHFSGVALVVSKLFHICEPTRAYFGQKDWQQLTIIKRLVNELKFNIDIVCIPIMREADGLAMSSRNRRLNPELRSQAPIINQSLRLASELLRKGEEVATVKKAVKEAIESQTELKLEYVEVADPVNLTPMNRVDKSAEAIIFVAAFAGEVRLIDNMYLE